jgi:hypothetical protein
MLNAHLAFPQRIFVLKQPRELFQGWPFRLWVQEEYDRRLDGQPDNVHDIIMPADVVDSDRIHELVEGSGPSGECLRDSNALGSVDEREDFCDEDVCERVHDRVEHVVHEDHAHDSTCSMIIASLSIISASSSPASEDYSHSDEGDQVLCPAAQDLGAEGESHSGNKIPAGERQVDFILNLGISDSASLLLA